MGILIVSTCMCSCYGLGVPPSLLSSAASASDAHSRLTRAGLGGSPLESKLLESVGTGGVSALEYTVSEGVAIVSLGGASPGQESLWGTKEEEHRLEPRRVLGLLNALDQAENDPSVFALVISAEGRFWCNGFDLLWIQNRMDLANALQEAVELLLARILQYPKPTLAAVNGHATAAGAMLMLACDFTIMNADKGFVFMPGIDLGWAYSPGMTSLMASKLPQQLHRDFIIYAQRFTAKTLASHGVVETAPPEQVLPQALQRAHKVKEKTKHPATMARIKATLYHEAIAALQYQPDRMYIQPRLVEMGFDNVPVGDDRPGSNKEEVCQGRRGGEEIDVRPTGPDRCPVPLDEDVTMDKHLAYIQTQNAHFLN